MHLRLRRLYCQADEPEAATYLGELDHGSDLIGDLLYGNNAIVAGAWITRCASTSDCARLR